MQRISAHVRGESQPFYVMTSSVNNHQRREISTGKCPKARCDTRCDTRCAEEHAAECDAGCPAMGTSTDAARRAARKSLRNKPAEHWLPASPVQGYDHRVVVNAYRQTSLSLKETRLATSCQQGSRPRCSPGFRNRASRQSSVRYEQVPMGLSIEVHDTVALFERLLQFSTYPQPMHQCLLWISGQHGTECCRDTDP